MIIFFNEIIIKRDSLQELLFSLFCCLGYFVFVKNKYE